MSNIYKIIYLNESKITKILVFYGNSEVEDLYGEFKKNPNNKIFENVFNTQIGLQTRSFQSLQNLSYLYDPEDFSCGTIISRKLTNLSFNMAQVRFV